jgi:ABC-2 type transport system permease protein
MLGTILRFELRYRLRQPAVYVLSLVYALLMFFMMCSDGVSLGGAVGQTAINSPFVITRMLAGLSMFSVVLVTAFVSTAVIRDFELSTDALFFTRPIRKLDLLVGRFLGAVAVALIVMIAAAVGMMIGTLMPWLDPARQVPFSLVPYAYALVVFVLPNLLVMGSFFFAVATLTRRVLAAHLSVVAFFVAYVVSEQLVPGLESDMAAALLDPFGLSAIQISTRYWTAVERNTELVPLGGVLGLNRVVWLSLAAACFAFMARRFSFTSRARKPGRDAGEALEASHTNTPLVVVTPSGGHRTTLAQLLRLLRVDLRMVLRGKAFILVAMFGAFIMYGGSNGMTEVWFGTPVLPVTRLMVEVVGMLGPHLMIVITFYAGELVHAERQVRMHEIHDAMPVPSWVLLLSKLGALWVAVFVLLGFGGLTAMAIQLARDYTSFELLLYVEGLWGLMLSQWVLVCVLAVVVQVVVGHKYLGFFSMMLFFISEEVMTALHFGHGLYRFAFSPEAPYSDMNGYGHLLGAVLWYRLYWTLWAAGLLVVASLLWVRGTETRLRLRLREARRRATRQPKTLLGVLALGISGVGAFILYNTTVLNRYRTAEDLDDEAMRYEQAFKAEWDGAPQPRLVAIDLEVDIFPDEREVSLRGTLTLVNEHDAAIERLFVTVEPFLTVESLELPPGTALLEHDEEQGVRIYQLGPPLAPGAELRLPFALRFAEPGFMNHGSTTQVVENGTILNTGFIPHIGYYHKKELTDPNERRKRGMPERERMRPPTDMAARANTFISREGDWIRFTATLSTSKDQIALVPGYLVKEWEDGDRRYFRYEMDAPMLYIFAIMSARYEVTRDRWNDVAIEVYHHASHDMNVPRMIDSVKASLDYCTRNFSPYQHRQLRIVEFPRYQMIAESHPNTIPYSESIGFIADLRDENRIDYVFYVTAHEVAHQWWAHQVVGGEVQGYTMLSETLSQYSALMVMEKEYGRTKVKKFLEYELDEYLRGRGAELEREMPLSLVENQPYVHYNKGSLVMYALREVLGEAALNSVLKQFIADKGFQEPPFTTSLELVERIRAAMPERFAYLVEDLFETITLYDNRALEATATPLDGERWRVDLVVESHKLRADGEGTETPVPMNDWLQIGVMGEDEDAEPLYLEWHHITGERTELSIEVSAEPATAGIDPRVLFIDREPDDNVRSVELRE